MNPTDKLKECRTRLVEIAEQVAQLEAEAVAIKQRIADIVCPYEVNEQVDAVIHGKIHRCRVVSVNYNGVSPFWSVDVEYVDGCRTQYRRVTAFDNIEKV